MPESRVVVVGSANVDVTVRVDRLPAPGETVLGRDLLRNPGGKGANQAIATARAGAAVSFVGAVGPDAEGALLRTALEGDRVDCRHLRTVMGPTGLAFVAVSDDGENQIVVHPGANGAVDAAAVGEVDELLRSAAVTLSQLEIHPSALAAIRERSGFVVLNPAPVRQLSATELGVDVLVPNATELATLAGVAVPTSAEQAISAARGLRGPSAVVVTLGSLGAVVVEGERSATVAAPPGVAVVDTTAAGDTLCGYLAAALAEGATLEEATRLGVAAASVSVTRPGAAASIPRRGEVAT